MSLRIPIERPHFHVPSVGSDFSSIILYVSVGSLLVTEVFDLSSDMTNAEGFLVWIAVLICCNFKTWFIPLAFRANMETPEAGAAEARQEIRESNIKSIMRV